MSHTEFIRAKKLCLRGIEMSKKILVVGPHSDDELASAGFFIKSMRHSCEVYVATFSFTKQSAILNPEYDACLRTLGVKTDNIFKYSYPTRDFPSFRQDILEDLVVLKKLIRPRVVLIPNSGDHHQDHHVIFNEGKRAFDRCTVLGYESPKHLLLTDNMYYATLLDQDFHKKMEGMHCYKSQVIRWGQDYLAYREPLAKLRGIQASCKYAEAFEVIRMIG